jgi:hypothetical protein
MLQVSRTAFVGELFGIGSASFESPASHFATQSWKRNVQTTAHLPRKMSSSKAALLIGGITHSRKEWEALSSVAALKVRFVQKVGMLWWG